MPDSLLNKLDLAPLLADGAMGTMLHAHGVAFDRCFDELNLTQPSVVADIHRAYVDAGARETIDRAGYSKYFGHGTGHGVGLDVHEAPSVSPTSKDILAPGMVITVEPGIYIPGWGGVRIEDMVMVKRDGFEVLTATSKELVSL